MKRRIVRSSLLALFVCFLLTPQAYAQGETGSVKGEVKDAAGNPIADVTVRIEGMTTGIKYRVKTGSDGKYVHTAVAVREVFRVIAQREGFRGDFVEQVKPGTRRSPNEGVVDFVLSPGQSGKLSFELTDQERAQMAAEVAEAKRLQKLMAAVRVEFNAGVQFYQQGQYEQAVESFKLGLAKDDSLPALWANLGNTYAKMNRNNEALEASQKAISLATAETLDAGFFQSLGGIYAAMGDTEKAKEAYLKAAGMVAEGDPKAAAESYYNMAVTMINSGQNEAATEALNKTLEADPSYAEAHYQLGLILLGTELDQAVKHLESYLEAAPNGPNSAVAKELIGQLQP